MEAHTPLLASALLPKSITSLEMLTAVLSAKRLNNNCSAAHRLPNSPREPKEGKDGRRSFRGLRERKDSAFSGCLKSLECDRTNDMIILVKSQ